MEFFTAGGGADELGAGYSVLSKSWVMGGGDRSKPRETGINRFLPISFLSSYKILSS